MFVIVTHATLIDGKVYEAPSSTLVEILRNKRLSFLFLRHSIDGKAPSKLFTYKKGLLIKETIFSSQIAINPLRYINEIFSTVLWFLKKKNNKYIYIGVDPLNAFSGIILKKLNKVEKVVFYTADYSKNRFSNPILNKIYHWMDSFCVRNAEEVWSVSSRIRDVRKKQGLSDKKNIFIPNVPSGDYRRFLDEKKNKYTLITLGIVGEQLDYMGMFDAILEMRKEYSQILMKIIGNGPKEEEYKSYIKKKNLEKNVLFLGYMNHEKALSEIASSGIGLALYNGNWSFNYFGDSMKCREYFAFGLPVITTDTHSTVEEIQKEDAGIVCKMEKNDYKKAIEKIWENYDRYSKNSSSLAEKYEGIHEKKICDLFKNL